MFRIGVDLGGTNIATGVIDEKYDMNLGTKNRIFRFLGSFVIETFAILLLIIATAAILLL